jgi:corrinoid protein of di/trimethylamine methyltransferase
MEVLHELSEQLQRGRAKEVAALVQQALDAGAAPRRVLEDGLMHGIGVVGEKFKHNLVFVPEVLIAARAMNAGIAVLKPYLVDDGVRARGTVVLGTVKGDLHDIGKNLVRTMMEGKGLEVVDLGVDVPAERFVREAIDRDADIVACSALLTTTMPEMRTVAAALVAQGVRERFHLMVGGAPVTDAYRAAIGADAYAPDATSAAEAAVAHCLAKAGAAAAGRRP